MGVTDHPGVNGIRLEWQGYVNPVKKVMKKPVFLRKQAFRKSFGGDKRDRTADLLNAIQALSQLSYTPEYSDF